MTAVYRPDVRSIGVVCNCDGKTMHVHDSPFPRAVVVLIQPQQDVCEKCHEVISIGDFPFCPHGRVAKDYGKGFEPYFDHGLGEEVHGWGDIHKAMREGHLDYRDHPSPGDTSARRDKIAEDRRRRSAR